MRASKGFLAVLTIVLLTLGLLAGPAQGQAQPQVREGDGLTRSVRYAGASRFATARLIANDTFATAETVLLARADAFPDALSGNYLAGQRGAPILLVETNRLTDETQQALDRLGARNVVLLGGTAAISQQLENQLRARYTVTRVGGRDRFDTAAQIAEAAGNRLGMLAGRRTAIVANGGVFADALVAGPIAYAQDFPLLLTTGTSLHQRTAQALSNLQITQVILAGGTAAISSGVEGELRARGVEVIRVSGASRVQTATAFANFAKERFGWNFSQINLARGDNFPDALTLGPRGGLQRSPLLLTATPNVLSGSTAQSPQPGTRDFLEANACQVGQLSIAGGTAAVSTAVEDQARRASTPAGPCPPDTLTLTPGTDTNTVGAPHAVTATLRFGDGTPKPGSALRFEVTGAGAPNPSSGTVTTDLQGQATFTYTNTTTGQDQIRACTRTDGTAPASCSEAGVISGSATKTWAAGPATTLTGEPPVAMVPVGAANPVTVTARDQYGNAVSGAPITFAAGDPYTVTTSADPGGPTFEPIDASAVGERLNLRCDDCTRLVQAPFPVAVFGVVTDQLRVSSNGIIHVDPPDIGLVLSWTNEQLPAKEIPPTAVAPYWDDLLPADGSPIFSVATLGTAPNRRFVVEWRDIRHITGAGTGTFQAIFSEASGDIVFQYPSVSGFAGATANGGSATIGLQADYHEAVMFSHNTAGAVADGMAVRFAEVFGPTSGTATPTPVNGTATTDASGQATFAPTSPTPGWLTVRACVQATDACTDVARGWHEALDGLTELQSPSPQAAVVGSTVTNLFEAHDAGGRQIPGVQVRFEAAGPGAPAPAAGTDTTDETGTAAFAYSATAPDVVSVTACTNPDGTLPSACTDPGVLTAAYAVAWHELPIAQIEIFRDPSDGMAAAGSPITVFAVAQDAGGRFVEPAWLRFEVTGDPAPSPTVFVSDSRDGWAQVTITNAQAGASTVTMCTNPDGSLPASCAAPGVITNTTTITWT